MFSLPSYYRSRLTGHTHPRFTGQKQSPRTINSSIQYKLNKGTFTRLYKACALPWQQAAPAHGSSATFDLHDPPLIAPRFKPPLALQLLTTASSKNRSLDACVLRSHCTHTIWARGCRMELLHPRCRGGHAAAATVAALPPLTPHGQSLTIWTGGHAVVVGVAVWFL